VMVSSLVRALRSASANPVSRASPAASQVTLDQRRRLHAGNDVGRWHPGVTFINFLSIIQFVTTMRWEAEEMEPSRAVKPSRMMRDRAPSASPRTSDPWPYFPWVLWGTRARRDGTQRCPPPAVHPPSPHV
jgi:hypothetical protein